MPQIAMLAAALALATAPTPEAAADFHKALSEAGALRDQFKSEECWTIVARLNADPATPAMPERDRRWLLRLTALCGAFGGHPEEGHAAALKATATGDGTDWVWNARLYAASKLKMHDEEIAVLAEIARKQPKALARLQTPYVLRLRSELAASPRSAARLFALDEALLANWAPADPGAWDAVAFAHTLALLEAGKTKEAETLAVSLSGAAYMLRIRIDRRFDAIAAAHPGAFDVVKAAEAELAASRTAAQAEPDSLKAVVTVADDLVRLNRGAEALALLDGALARLARDGAAFKDGAEWKPWAHSTRGTALASLGRKDEGLAAMQAAVDAAGETPKEKTDRASHALNLAQALMENGRPEEALALAGPVTELSKFGKANRLLIIACAQADLGRTAEAKAALKDLRALQPMGGLTQLALFCLDEDEAAALLARRLQDPKQRYGALAGMQTFLPEPALGRMAAVMAARKAAVEARPKVRALAERYGHLESYALTRP